MPFNIRATCAASNGRPVFLATKPRVASSALISRSERRLPETARVMMTLMRNGRDRRSENPFRATRGKNACLCLGPISGSHQGQRPQRLHSKTGYMAAPERFAETSDSFSLHRGRRPYMALGVFRCGAQNSDAIGGTADIDRPPAPIASEAYDPEAAVSRVEIPQRSKPLT
jgi:hypothetical protein